MTTVPPGFGVETLTGQTYWGWVTTTRADGTYTVLPVVAGNMLWELPTIQHVDFYFPQFNLPRFSLPCIRLLFIELGQCQDPPTPDDSPSNGNSPSPPPPGNPPNPTQSEPQQETSSCTGIRTVSNCEVTCSMSVANPSSTVTACYNTICSTTTTSCSSIGTTATTMITGDCPMTILPAGFYQMPDSL